jgi:arylformamidase
MAHSIQINGRTYAIESAGLIDISIPLNFNGEQPNAYGVENAAAAACEAGDIVGDTRLGGSCNFERYTLIPHCNGTHTECVGHITRERISVRDCLADAFIQAALVTVEPVRTRDTSETYAVPFGDGDRLITRSALETRQNDAPNFSLANGAMIIRTLPNDERKLTRRYGSIIPPFFTTEAMEYITALGVKHLLVDMPSVDRLYDEGKLSNHRIFWNIRQGSFALNPATRVNSTITELIYVPNDVPDGEYLLNLQIAPFAADTSPSRPVLFGITSV